MAVPERLFVENLRKTSAPLIWRVRFSRILREFHAPKRGNKAYGLVDVPDCFEEPTLLARTASKFLRASA
jgi:hypothetical protein